MSSLKSYGSYVNGLANASIQILYPAGALFNSRIECSESFQQCIRYNARRIGRQANLEDKLHYFSLELSIRDPVNMLIQNFDCLETIPLLSNFWYEQTRLLYECMEPSKP